MKTFEIQMPDPIATKIEQAAERLNISPKEFVLLSVEEKLSKLDEEFRQAAAQVLRKNAELYRRLA